MNLAYFPGCAATGTGRELNSSTLAAAAAYGATLVEIPAWVCCGASAAHMTSEKLARALPARSLAAVRRMDADGVVTACAACYNRLRIAEDEIEADARLRVECEKLVEGDLSGDLKVLHVLDLFTAGELEPKVSARLGGMRVACYYGCLLTRPASVSVDPNPVNPTVMDDLVGVCGLEPVEWPFKTECCGASMVLPHPESVARLSGRLLDAAQQAGARAVIVACPLCHSNLDLKQPAATRRVPDATAMPVLYVTEVIALALGVPPRKLDLARHTIPVPALV